MLAQREGRDAGQRLDGKRTAGDEERMADDDRRGRGQPHEVEIVAPPFEDVAHGDFRVLKRGGFQKVNGISRQSFLTIGKHATLTRHG